MSREHSHSHRPATSGGGSVGWAELSCLLWTAEAIVPDCRVRKLALQKVQGALPATSRPFAGTLQFLNAEEPLQGEEAGGVLTKTVAPCLFGSEQGTICERWRPGKAETTCTSVSSSTWCLLPSVPPPHVNSVSRALQPLAAFPSPANELPFLSKGTEAVCSLSCRCEQSFAICGSLESTAIKKRVRKTCCMQRIWNLIVYWTGGRKAYFKEKTKIEERVNWT